MRQHTLNVSLTPQLAALIREKVETGLYHSASEVVRDALRLLVERDRTRAFTSERLQAGLDLYASGIEIMSQNLRRDFPDESDTEIETRLSEWLATDDYAAETAVDIRNAPERLNKLLGE